MPTPRRAPPDVRGVDDLSLRRLRSEAKVLSTQTMSLSIVFGCDPIGASDARSLGERVRAGERAVPADRSTSTRFAHQVDHHAHVLGTPRGRAGCPAGGCRARDRVSSTTGSAGTEPFVAVAEADHVRDAVRVPKHITSERTTLLIRAEPRRRRRAPLRLRRSARPRLLSGLTRGACLELDVREHARRRQSGRPPSGPLPSARGTGVARAPRRDAEVVDGGHGRGLPAGAPPGAGGGQGPRRRAA